MATTQENTTKRKRFLPLENNPDVMTKLLHTLGLDSDLEFHDVFSIDDPDLLAFVPRPAHALLLVFPVSKTYQAHRQEEDQDRADYNGSGADEPVIWYPQTISNACGLMGLLHGVSNGEARNHIWPGSNLDKLIKEAIPLQPKERAALIENSEALESAHNAAAVTGDTAAPDLNEEVDLHYVCFVKSAKDGHLWELDGSRKGPLDRGPLKVDEDVLSEAALDKGARAFMKREQQTEGGELRFSLIVLGPAFD
ncbi:ubiquitin hydrolase L3 [Piedraia hortae CBS 480.64]|uniref:Ubiquitin carboxyl-terminal hydrolase n=1 Tax=Piedraia hortae CBS 480.64 TaxID=1314780 RepID=A0A6A7BX30_9PEZI|nr:ubiquitin hydrolase L3 [Piedraia hortae CBS 480.64]